MGTLCLRIFYSERNFILHAYAHSMDDTICFESRRAISCTSGVTRDAIPSTSGVTKDAIPSTSGVNADLCTTTNTMDDPMVPSDEEIQEPEIFTTLTTFRPINDNDKKRTSRLSTFHIRTNFSTESDTE